jgi:hypothetical protein
MNLFQRTLFAAGILLTLVSLIACSAETADDAGSAIAEFDLPAGYTFEFNTSMLGYTVTSYKGPAGPSHLYLIQSEQESDGDELEKMLTQLVPGSSDPNTRLTVIENRPVTIRGQEVTLIVSEGVNSENVSYRQATALFEGRGGPALLVFSESLEAWDQAALDELLASIH